MNILIENLNYSYLRLLKVFPRYFNVKTAYEYARKPEKIAKGVLATIRQAKKALKKNAPVLF